jgi:hypothetical protein
MNELLVAAADMLIADAEAIGGEWGPWEPPYWAERTRIVNGLRAAVGLPLVAFDRWGKVVGTEGAGEPA